MSDQFTMFDLTTSADSCSVTSSPESACGPTLCETPDGPTTSSAGQDHARVPRSRRQDSGRAKRTNAIYGRLGFHSSPSDDLALCLANKLVPLTASLGSTMFDLIWKERRTPSGHSIYALRASARQTSGSDFTSWPTPQSRDFRSGTEWKCGHPERSNDLNDFALLAAWGSPQARDHFPAHRPEYIAEKTAQGHGMQNLNDQVALAGWGTPKVKTGAYQYAGGDHNNIVLNLEGQANLARLTDSGETPIGYSLGPNGWEIVPASGQLNPALSRWLQGLPPVFCESAVTAMQSMPKSRRRSSAPMPTPEATEDSHAA